MMNVCVNCGLYRSDKTVDPDGPYAICPECGHRHPFLQLPLLIVAGASSTGKSTICYHLLGRLKEVVALEADILWRAEFDKPGDRYREFFELLLRLCKNISQSGRPVVLFCSGGNPDNVEPCVERRYFSEVHYLALTCEDAELVQRLTGRPAWRKSGAQEFVKAQVEYNRWFKEGGSDIGPPVELLDTTEISEKESVEAVALWVREKLGIPS